MRNLSRFVISAASMAIVGAAPSAIRAAATAADDASDPALWDGTCAQPTKLP